MSEPELGFALRDPHRWPDLAGLVRLGEALGYTAVFLPEVGARDTLATLAALAGVTTRLRLATGVVPLPARSPGLLAMAAATVHELSGGRLILGLGTGPARSGALDRLRQTVLATRAALSTGHGRLGEEQIDLGLIPGAPPIWIAALGPRAARLAGEVAGGVLLNWCTPERVADAVSQVGEGAKRAGRDPASVTIAVYVRACIAPDEASATEALKTAAAEYASYPAYARQFASLGLGEEAERAAIAHRAADPSGVPQRLVEAVTLTGHTARDRLKAYMQAGAHLPIVYPVPCAGSIPAESVADTLEALAPASA
jgi:alkanesulfonate monooxygenase SsuD/methylene tetrahydromethanopterin reductase-like flavin-dependent oxidoreductase (luciferase family)